jgi:uncharacterized membrane protein YphA (DoxX/SURF4 family)
MTSTATQPRVKLNVALWILQILIGLLFLWAGAIKLVLPLEQLKGPIDFPGWFIRFIGVVEVLGGLGLILPGLLRIKPGLTPLAAAGLVIIMIGATFVGIVGGPPALASVPIAIGSAAGFIAYSRWRLVPHRDRK